MELSAGAVAGFAAGCGADAAETKLALNPSTLRGYNLPFLEQVRVACAAGWRGLEPWLRDLRAAQAAGQLAEACRVASDGGLAFVNGIAFGQWAADDPKVRAEGLEETKRDMALLAEIGCPCVAASMFGMHKPGTRALPAAVVAERYAAVLDLGRAAGVRPLLEYWGHSANLSTPEAAWEVLDLLKRPDAAILADVYHTHRGGGSFAAYRRFTSATLPVLHVNDYPAAPAAAALTDADRVWPGDGAAPWKEILGTLRAGGVSPWFSLELFNPSYWRTSPRETARTGLAKTRATCRFRVT